MEELKNKKIALLGLGVEGIATAEFLLQQGLSFTVIDRKTEAQLAALYPDVYKNLKDHTIAFIGGEKSLVFINDFEVVFRSPGISVLTPEIVAAQQKGVTITSQTKLFFDLCPCPIIGVTGTKGKGTTSTLIYKMLEKSGKHVFLGGNIGQAPITFLDQLTKDSIVVLELSSFQLQDMTKSPHIAVVLMITSEHLDYHATTEEYVDAKRNILRSQTTEDFAVINRDYLASNESDIHTDGQVYWVSREREAEQGCFVKDGKIFFRKDVLSSQFSVLRDKSGDEEIIATNEIALPGRHNWENVCAAVMAASLAGASKEASIFVLKTFAGLEHRLEFVAEIDGVTYYDDSFSTTPETAIAAIEAFQEPEILILGGSSKGSDFAELGQVISHATNIKAIIGIGEEWRRIKEKLTIENGQLTIIETAGSMKEIILEASEIAERGDIVLLSPGCASFGMFANYKDRGEKFKREVQNLKD